MFGLSPEWLLHDGKLLASAIVLSDAEQAERLAADCPEALPAAVVAGDPCYDRLLASLPHRSRYRRALGLRGGQRLVLISSTWGPDSLFGRHPRLARRLLGSLPADEFRVAVALHPNTWHGHGPGQVEAWLADARRAGLLVVPPEEGWRAAVVAADAVFGDHGSVSYYAAALGRPVVLNGAGAHTVAADSPVARLLATAAAYDPRCRPETLIDRAENAREQTEPVARRWVSSQPGRALELIRRSMYRLMGAAEPADPVPVDAVPAPEPQPGPRHPAMWVCVSEPGERSLSIRRVPAAAMDRSVPEETAGGFLAAADTEPDSRLAGVADMVVCPVGELPERGDDWCRAVFADRPAARAAAYYDAEGCALHTRSGERIECAVEESGPGFDPGLLCAALYHFRFGDRAGGRHLPSGEPRLRVRAGGDRDTVVRISRTGPR